MLQQSEIVDQLLKISRMASQQQEAKDQTTLLILHHNEQLTFVHVTNTPQSSGDLRCYHNSAIFKHPNAMDHTITAANADAFWHNYARSIMLSS